ncbi:hypothetical protein ACHAXT_000400 [Thalassiosira profunda]
MFAASASTRARLLARSFRRIARSGAGRAPAAAFSTISFDGSAFDVPATSSSESPGTPYSFWKQLPPVNQPARQLSKNTSADQFLQQTQQWIASNPKIAPYKAEEALARLWVDQQKLFRQWEQQQQKTPLPTVLLTTESVNLVLEAWCMSSNGEVAAERAERLLRWMEDLQPEDSAWAAFLPKADYQSYATCIDAWSRAAVYESTHPSPSGSDEIEKKSGGRAKSHVVSSATKNGFECAKRAEDLLMHMQSVHEQRLERSDSYNSDIQPDTRVFNAVLTSWAKIHGGTKASATRAMRILDLMQELHHYQSMKATEWQSLAFSKVQPNLKTYKLVLEAWASANHTLEGPDRAEEILRHLLSLSKAGNLGVEISPDAECFNIVMKAHAEAIRKRRKGGDGSASVERAQRVTALLDWMELLAMRNAKVRPTTESYRIALSAWVWSHHVNAPMEADGILYRMIRAGEASDRESSILASGVPGTKPKLESLVQPDTRDFNTVINCCSFARRVGLSEEDDDSLLQRQIAHEEVFNIAEAALNALLASKCAKPDSATFAGIIRACLNLLPNTDERDERVIELFRLAYRTPPAETPPTKITSTSAERMAAPPGAGCVDANVLRHLRHALPSTEDYIRVREEFEEARRKNVGDE